MFRLLALLQLTRAALAFTAVADAWTVLLLRRPAEGGDSMAYTIFKMVLIAIISLGLYGFGMALNDLLDARRDRVFAPRRPIPSGRIAARSAVQITLLLLVLSLITALVLSILQIHDALAKPHRVEFVELVPWPFIFAVITVGLIVLYDGTTKYLGGIGILTLGVIRAVHCLIPDPRVPLLYLSMFLLCHVFFVSLVAYRLENKRPRLGRLDVRIGVVSVFLLCALALGYTWKNGVFPGNTHRMLFGPAGAAIVFVVWAWLLGKNQKLSQRQKGERLMLMGLFWLFVYDASMLFSNGQILAGISVVLLFFCALFTFFGIRKLSRSMAQERIGFKTERMAQANA